MNIRKMQEHFENNTPIWYRDEAADRICESTITGINSAYAHIRDTNEKEKVVNCTSLFSTYDECMDFYMKQNEALTNEYKQELSSVEDVVRFCFHHNMDNADSYSDPYAQRAVIERMTELNGVVLYPNRTYEDLNQESKLVQFCLDHRVGPCGALQEKDNQAYIHKQAQDYFGKDLSRPAEEDMPSLSDSLAAISQEANTMEM